MRTRSVLLASILVLTASMGAATASAAASVRYGVSWPAIAQSGPDCVSGRGPVSVTLDITLRAGTTDLETVSPATDETGAFQACFADGSVQPGRALVTTDRTFVLPKLTVRVNRGTNLISGVGPKGMKLVVRMLDCPNVEDQPAVGPTLDCKTKPKKTLTIPASGKWSLAATFDLRALDAAVVLGQTTAGDAIGQLDSAPLMLVSTSPTLDQHEVILVKLGSSSAVVRRLAKPGGAVLEQLSVSLSGGFGSVDLTDLEAGNQVTANIAPDAKLVVPAIEPTLVNGPKRVRARCYANQPVGFIVLPEDPVWVKANSAGVAFLPLEANGLSVNQGSAIVIICIAPTGDAVRLLDTVQ